MAWPELNLPIAPPFAPMEARLVPDLAAGDCWQYEPKWDGFRLLAFRDGDAVALQSKSGQPLGRYFPEVEAALRSLPASRFVLDGELVVPTEGGFAFEPLLMRIHPARSRVERLARESPAAVLAFDLLVDDAGRSLVERTLAERRVALEGFSARHLGAARGAVGLSPVTRDRDEAVRWLAGGRKGVDGVVAKHLDAPYLGGERAMEKVKRRRTADCVVGGFRWAANAEGEVGSLLLGLYGDDGRLHYVGHTASFSRAERREVSARFVPMKGGEGFSGEAPGGPSRWARGRSTEWEPVRPDVVVEVEFTHVSGGRFRHGTRLVRYRPDKDPRSCTFDQMEGTARAEPAAVQPP
jgi:ATP-dependent DNA ligase